MNTSFEDVDRGTPIQLDFVSAELPAATLKVLGWDTDTFPAAEASARNSPPSATPTSGAPLSVAGPPANGDRTGWAAS